MIFAVRFLTLFLLFSPIGIDHVCAEMETTVKECPCGPNCPADCQCGCKDTPPEVKYPCPCGPDCPADCKCGCKETPPKVQHKCSCGPNCPADCKCGCKERK